MEPCEILLSRRALRTNFQRIRANAAGLALFPVVKANAYGHGATLIARELEAQFSIDELPLFCVAQTAEAIELRRAGIQREILVLSAFEKSDFALGVRENLSFVLANERDLSSFLEQGSELQQRLGVHLKFNTGMNRLGFSATDYLQNGSPLLEKFFQSAGRIEGLMSHLAKSEDEPPTLVLEQAELFSAVIKKAQGALAQQGRPSARWVHLANSASLGRGLLKGIANAGRPGLRLWGVYQDAQDLKNHLPESAGFQPVLSLKSTLRQISEVPAGGGVGYGHQFVATTPSLIATLAVGYADGLRRQCATIGNKTTGTFSLLGERVPIVGTISMDMCTVDLSRHSQRDRILADYKKGNPPPATWLGEGLRAETAASDLSTISYELFCGLGSRIKRSLDE